MELFPRIKKTFLNISTDQQGWETIHRVGSLSSWITMLLVFFTILISLSLYDKNQQQTINTHEIIVNGTTYSCISVDTATGTTTALSCQPKDQK